METEFEDAALILIGHGSTLNGDSSAPIYLHADAIRKQGQFAEVQECFWKLEPSISSVCHQVFSPRVFVVPVFISEGYFTQQVIPRELGFCSNGEESFSRVLSRAEQRLYYCDPVGTHLSMTQALAHRATEVLDQYPFPSRPADTQVSLFIAGHGTGNNQNSRKIIEDQAAALRSSGRYADVHAVFMEENPRIESCYELASSRNIVMVPFFISDGLHSFEDIPVMLGESKTTVAKRLREHVPTWRNPTERHGKRVWYTKSIGLDPAITDVIIERVHEAVSWTENEKMIVNGAH
jgi:sirohydrochlorin cobaltochelatase